MAAKGRVGPGIAGSDFSGDDLDFPEVPYSPQDFTDRQRCPSTNGNLKSVSKPVV